MTELRNMIHDMRRAFAAALYTWRESRHFRRGGNPDAMPF